MERSRRYGAVTLTANMSGGNTKPTTTHKKKKNLRNRKKKAAGKKGTTLKKKNDNTSAFCLRCRAWRGELGLEPTFELYIKHLCNVFDEVKRVLKKMGTLWVNLGDTYGGSGGASGAYQGHHEFRIQNLGNGSNQRHDPALYAKMSSSDSLAFRNRDVQ